MMARALLPGLLLFAAACGPATEDTAILRGDVAFAADSLEEALAEYRLAMREGDESAEVIARIAHTYGALGRVDESSDFYRRAVRLEPELSTQAVADLMRLARRAREDGKGFEMASAVSNALEFEPALGLGDMALPLARHYFTNGEYGRALPLYQRALVAGSDTLPAVVFEIGQAHEEIGDCQRALVFFEQFRGRASRSQRSEVDWYIGNCSFQLARRLRAEGEEALGSPESRPSITRAPGIFGDRDRRRDPRRSSQPRELPLEAREPFEAALAAVDRTIEVGEPRNIQGQAWFERGEILALLGECNGAMESFAQVRYAEPGGTGPLVTRAQARFDEIRFGRGLEGFRRAGGCG